MLVVLIAALLLANLVQWMTNERQRAIAEQARLEAEVARQAAEVALLKAQVLAEYYRAQVPEEPRNTSLGPKTRSPDGGTK
jgi:hypothetical protein